MATAQALEKPKLVPRKPLAHCFDEACERFRNDIAVPLIRKDPNRQGAVDLFLNGTKMESVVDACKKLNSDIEEKTNNAARLLVTLDQLKTLGDAFMGFAPESVSIVWFGISSLIAVGNAKVQTRLLICGTCDSITNIVADCIRWEARMAQIEETASDINIWDSDIPDLVFDILDFLWSARPHLDQSKVKRIGSTLKDLFTKEIQQKAEALVEKYASIVKVVQSHFEDSVLHESLKTGQKIDQITSDIKEFSRISTEIVEAVQRQSLLAELDYHRERLTYSQSYELHFGSLRDRLTKIKSDRSGRLPVAWLHKDRVYQDWKGDSKTKFLCLRAPRGHGKSVAMMSTRGELIETSKADGKGAVICHFFYKKGEQDIQTARAGLEAILYQLLSSTLRDSISALIAAVEVLNPNFGELEVTKEKVDFSESVETLCNCIRGVAEAAPARVYIMVDALDECMDRRDQGLAQSLRSITRDGIKNVRVIISARDSFDIVSELVDTSVQGAKGANIAKDGPSNEDTVQNQTLPDSIQIIDITSEKNAVDLEEFLRHEVSQVLQRRINRQRLGHLFDLELARIVKIMHQKAKGDFTLARIIIGTLQQPSKDSLEEKIQRLPAAIGEIYMQSIESLTPDEQELIVTALKWVVWSVRAMSVIEIADHYRDIFKKSNHTQGIERRVSPEGEYAKEVRRIIRKNPYEDPEIKDIIHHLENAGRDFFRLDRHTGLASVDISVREWIQDDNPDTNSTSEESRGFAKYRDLKGNTVFRFTLTPSFVRYGDSLSELFNKRDAQMSITLNILRALNSTSFQRKHMPWLPDWFTEDNSGAKERGQGPDPGPRGGIVDELHKRVREELGFAAKENDYLDIYERKPRKQQILRYEVLHWQDHIRILQQWWNDGSRNDTWWTELLTELAIFMRPENWYRWNIQRPLRGVNKHPYERLALRFFEEPIHFASANGLPLMIDYLVEQKNVLARSKLDENRPRREADVEDFTVSRVKAITRALFSVSFYSSMDSPFTEVNDKEPFIFGFKRALESLSLHEAFAVLNITLRNNPRSLRITTLVHIINSMDSSLRIAWLALQSLVSEKKEDQVGQDAPTKPGYTRYSEGRGFGETLLEGKSMDKIEDGDTDTSTEQEPNLPILNPYPKRKNGNTSVVQTLKYGNASVVQTLSRIYENFESKEGNMDIQKEVEDFLQQHHNNHTLIESKFRERLSSTPELFSAVEFPLRSICDKLDPSGHLPLFLAGEHPPTIETLIKHKANVNAHQIIQPVAGNVRERTALLSMLMLLTRYQENTNDLSTAPALFTSVRTLITEGAALDVKTNSGSTPLHLAAKIGNLKLFKLLALSSEWDVHEVDAFQKTPLHYLFDNPAPNNPDKVREILEICQVILKMRRSDGGDLINAEDKNSETPLAGAAKAGFKQAVELLVQLGADITDENTKGENYFHLLARGKRANPDTELGIASILLDGGLDCTKSDNIGLVPLAQAVAKGKWRLVDFFLQIYDTLAETSESAKDNPLLKQDLHGYSILHIFARGPEQLFQNETDDIVTNYFQKVSAIVSKYGDLRDLVAQRNLVGETPLHLAIRYRRLGVVKAILNIRTDNDSRDHSGLTPLDYIFYQFAFETARLATNNYMSIAMAPTMLATTKAIWIEMIKTMPPSSFSHFETAFFEDPYRDPDNESYGLTTTDLANLPEGFKMQDIIRLYETSSTDQHGWSVFDVLSMCEGSHLASLCSWKPDSSLGGFLRPSEGQVYQKGEIINLDPSRARLRYVESLGSADRFGDVSILTWL
ncbi:hypothetical protein H072_3473 [Dactylellina haptotyla CBS 200.50]|uniref:Nephrocystin 3-like N-terminal domain-containing protein n=1 Tax=Dactylellina haptotyla (strain CBS 200.50) TaxID=1284197 RepID=S8AI30_DACHA|nr:hypothetical protein H072_3473 [Dactylellina haptotyla CBS 200.50]